MSDATARFTTSEITRETAMRESFPGLSTRSLRWKMTKDTIAMIMLFALSVGVVYLTTQSLSRIFFLAILVVFLFSRKDYFWFAYFFIVAQGPGYFFADFSGASLHRLPLYTFLPGMSFTPIDLFVLIALAKALDRGKKMSLQLKGPLLILLAYIIFAVGISAVIYGADVDIIAQNARWVFCYSVIISFLCLVREKNDIYRFMLVVFPFVFLILFTQISFVITGSEFINLFNPGFRSVTLNTLTGELRPVTGGILAVFLGFIFAIVLLEDKYYRLPKLYLYIVMAAAFFSIFLSATRIWFVIFSFIFAGYLFVSRKKFVSAVGLFSISLLAISVLTYSGLISLDFLVQSSWGRLQQVFSIARGDVYSVDNAMNRIVNQLPIIVGIMKQNLFIGYGFSDIAMHYYDDDFGFLNTILLFGLVGFSLFIFFFVRLIRMLTSSIGRLGSSNPFKISLKILLIVWVGILIGYFSTWDFFTMSLHKVFFISVLIVIVESFVTRAKEEELREKGG